jgi:hypothetical protein
MIKRKQNKKITNDETETEHKDYQWSKGNRTQRLSMIKRKQNTKTIQSLCYVAFWSLIVFVFCFRLIIESLYAMFPCDHWDSLCSASFWSFIVFVLCNRTQRLSMIKRKQNTKTINDQKETEHKDYQWSKGNRTKILAMITRKQNTKTINDLLIIDSLCVLFPFDHWESLCYVSFWSLRVFVFCFLLIIDSLCVTKIINDQKET